MEATILIDGIDTYNEGDLRALFGNHGFAGWSKITWDICSCLFTADADCPDFQALIGALVLVGFTVAKITEEEAKQ